MMMLAALTLAAIHAAAAATPGCGSDAFDVWAVANARSYATPAIKLRRAAIFTQNCLKYEQLSAVSGGAAMAPDEWSDLTTAEFIAARSNGCYSETAEENAATTPQPPGLLQASGAVDWRDASKNPLKKVAVTHVKNQGAFGTCWSFGVAENLEGLNVRQGHALTNISEQEFISCCDTCQVRK